MQKDGKNDEKHVGTGGYCADAGRCRRFGVGGLCFQDPRATRTRQTLYIWDAEEPHTRLSSVGARQRRANGSEQHKFNAPGNEKCIIICIRLRRSASLTPREVSKAAPADKLITR